MKLTRDNVQLLYNKLFDLSTEKVEETTLSKLPTPTTPLPRAKPVRYSALVDTFLIDLAISDPKGEEANEMGEVCRRSRDQKKD